MSKEYLEALGLVKRTCELYIETTRFLKGSDIIANQIKEALNTIQNRLEAIDNANPSEALECLEEIRDFRYGKDKLLVCQTKMYKTIKQALLKAQEPKHYLKWEDLEFSFKDKCMKVKLNENIYTLRYTRNALTEFPVAYLEFDNTEITIIDCKKQFFNDLHLERVEE